MAVIPIGSLWSLLLAAAVTLPSGQDAQRDRRAIEQVREAFIRGFANGQADSLSHLFAQDYVDHSVGVTTIGRDAMRQRFVRIFRDYTCTLTIKPEEVIVNGSWALEQGTFEAEYTPRRQGVDRLTAKRRYMEILQRQPDGSWKIFRDIDADIP